MLLVDEHELVAVFFVVFRYLVVVSHFVFFIYMVGYFRRYPVLKMDVLPFAVAFASLLIWFDIVFSFTTIDYTQGNRIIVSSNVRHLGHIVMLSSLYSIIKIMCRSHFVNSYWFIVTCINVSLLFWLGGRGALLAFFVALGFVVYLQVLVKRVNFSSLIQTLVVILISFIIGSLLSVFDWNGFIRLVSQIHEQVRVFPQVGLDIVSIATTYKTGDSITERYDLWLQSWYFFMEKPWLGHGVESFFIKLNQNYFHPHNFIIQFLVEFGVIGTLAFLAFYGFLVLKSFQITLRRPNIQNYSAVSMLLALFVQSLVSGSLYFSPPVMVFCMVGAYTLAVSDPIALEDSNAVLQKQT
jgi:O-antigen ligase